MSAVWKLSRNSILKYYILWVLGPNLHAIQSKLRLKNAYQRQHLHQFTSQIINLNTILENCGVFPINKSNIRLLIGLFLVKYRMTKQICFFHNSYLNLYVLTTYNLYIYVKNKQQFCDRCFFIFFPVCKNNTTHD